MKRYEYMHVLKPTMKHISELGTEGWDMCGCTEDPISFVKEFWFKREISDTPDYASLLIDCAYRRGVAQLQHRTIAEFAQFVDDVMSKPEYQKYLDFDINSTHAIENWIEKFHEYCKEYYSKCEEYKREEYTKLLEEEIEIIRKKSQEEEEEKHGKS